MEIALSPILILSEGVREVVLKLRAKLFDKDHAPQPSESQTIIGKDYIRVNVDQQMGETRRAPLIKKGGNIHFKSVDLPETNESIVPYGPFYHHLERSECWKAVKEEAWNHVLKSTGGDENETTRLYFETLLRVEGQARAQYGTNDPSITDLLSDDFVRMMIRDGCFLLQVALVVLGGSAQLMGYPPSDPLNIEKILEGYHSDPYWPLFDCNAPEDGKEMMIRTAVWSMFFVGNQIPLVVLNELMRQSFFKKVLHGGIWEQPLELERLVLFELLLVPAMLDGESGGISVPTSSLHGDHRLFGRCRPSRGVVVATRFLKSIMLKPFSARPSGRKKASSKKANDLLHGLWLLVTGKLAHTNEDDEDHADENNIYHDSSIYSVVPHTVRSATELKEVGVVFQKIEGTRINGIRFQKRMLNASLVLPQIVVDKFHKASIYNVLLDSLIQYEVIHFGESKRIVCEYLQFMRGLIRTPEDAKILAAKGIIVVDPNVEEHVPDVFKTLTIPTAMRNHNSPLRRITDEMNNYTDPSILRKLSDVLSFVVILTLIQTVYSVLSYQSIT